VRDPFDIIIHPYVTERALRLMDRENKLQFLVKRDATKTEIKYSIEEIFKVKVESVNTLIMKNGKRAIVKLSPEYSAEEIGMRIGVF